MNKPDNRSPYERIQDRRRDEIEASIVNPPAWLLEARKPKAAAPRHGCAHCYKPVNNGRRSIEIDVIDPARHFCTLRCAAAYGVARVTELLAAKQAADKVQP